MSKLIWNATSGLYFKVNNDVELEEISRLVYLKYDGVLDASFVNCPAGVEISGIDMSASEYDTETLEALTVELNSSGGGIYYVTSTEGLVDGTYTTIYVGQADVFEGLTSDAKGVLECSGTDGSFGKGDNIFIFEQNLVSPAELKEVILHEIGILNGEIVHDLTGNGPSIDDYSYVETHGRIVTTAAADSSPFDGVISLKEALVDYADGTGLITFSEVTDGRTINIDDLYACDNVTIQGNGTDKTILSGKWGLNNNYHLTLKDLSISGQLTPSLGVGALTAENVNFKDERIYLQSIYECTIKSSVFDNTFVHSSAKMTYIEDTVFRKSNTNTSYTDGFALMNLSNIYLKNVEFSDNKSYFSTVLNLGNMTIENASFTTTTDTLHSNSGSLILKGNVSSVSPIVIDNSEVHLGNGEFAFSINSDMGANLYFDNTENISITGNVSNFTNVTFNGATVNMTNGNFAGAEKISIYCILPTMDAPLVIASGNLTFADNQLFCINDWSSTKLEQAFAVNGYNYILTYENGSLILRMTDSEGTPVQIGEKNVVYDDIIVEDETFSNINSTGDGGALENNGNAVIENSEYISNSSDENGGAIDNNGTADLFDVIFNANSAENGGAISNDGVLDVLKNDFLSNEATSGGALFNEEDANIKWSEFDNNSAVNGGAIFNEGDLDIQISTFENNEASQDGGALYNDGQALIENSDFNGNSAAGRGGAVYNAPESYLELEDVIFDANKAELGGAVYNDGNITIDDTVFKNNDAENGGALFNAGDGTLSNVKFNGNSADEAGGAIYNEGTLAIDNSSFITADDTIYNNGSITLSGAIDINASVDGGADGYIFTDEDTVISFSGKHLNSDITAAEGSSMVFDNNAPITVNGRLEGFDSIEFKGELVDFTVEQDFSNVSIIIDNEELFDKSQAIIASGNFVFDENQAFTVNSIDDVFLGEEFSVDDKSFTLKYNNGKLFVIDTTTGLVDKLTPESIEGTMSLDDAILNGYKTVTFDCSLDGKSVVFTDSITAVDDLYLKGNGIYNTIIEGKAIYGAMNELRFEDISVCATIYGSSFNVSSKDDINIYANDTQLYANIMGARVDDAVGRVGNVNVTIEHSVICHSRMMCIAGYVTSGVLKAEDVTVDISNDVKMFGANNTLYAGGYADFCSSIVVENVNINLESDAGTGSVFGGALMYAESTFVSGEVNIRIIGGYHNYIVAGSKLYSGTSVQGTSHIYLENTSLNASIIGGGAAYGNDACAVVDGDTNIYFNGGTCLYHIFAGGGSSDSKYAVNTTVEGSTYITLDSSKYKLCIKKNVNAGSGGAGIVNGDTHLTITGLGSNYDVNQLNGDSEYATDDISYITGKRYLNIVDFTGTCNSKIKDTFDDVTFSGNTTVTFSNKNVALSGVSNWNFQLYSSDNTVATMKKGTNNFLGDSINVSFDEDAIDSDGAEWTLINGVGATLAGWEEFSSVTLFDTVATFDNAENRWISADGNYSLFCENNALKVAKLA